MVSRWYGGFQSYDKQYFCSGIDLAVHTRCCGAVRVDGGDVAQGGLRLHGRSELPDTYLDRIGRLLLPVVVGCARLSSVGKGGTLGCRQLYSVAPGCSRLSSVVLG